MCLLFRRTFEIIERRSRIVSDFGDNNFAGKLQRLRNWSLNAKREKLNLFYERATKEQTYACGILMKHFSFLAKMSVSVKIV